MIAGGVIAGQGEIELLPLIGVVWTCAVLGDTTSFYIGRRLGRALPREARPAREDHARAARAGRGLLRPARRQDDPDRPLHRARPRAGAVHRRVVRAHVPALPPVQHRRLRRCGPRSSASSATSSGARSTRSQHIVGQALFGFAVTVARDRRRGDGVPAPRRDPAPGSTRIASHPLVKPLFVIGRPLYRWIVRPLARVLTPPAHFVVQPAHAGRARAGAHDARRRGRSGRVLLRRSTSCTSPTSFAPTPLDNDLLDLADRAAQRHARGRREGGHQPRRAADRDRAAWWPRASCSSCAGATPRRSCW